MTDELISENLETPEVKPGEAPEGESSEVSPSEPSEEAPIEEPLKEIPEVKPEAPQLEYTKERHDGLMAQWQKDRTELSKFQDKEKVATQKVGQNQDDVLVEYLDKKLEERRTAKEQVIQDAVTKEVGEAKTAYPQFSEKQLLETANDLSSGNRPVSIMTAAIHLSKLAEAIKTKGDLTAEEVVKKQKAGTMAGRSGVQTTTGLRPYDSKLDSGKPIDELVDDGAKELGI